MEFNVQFFNTNLIKILDNMLEFKRKEVLCLLKVEVLVPINLDQSLELKPQSN